MTLEIKMLNSNSTRSHLYYVERMCLHTGNFGTISYDFVAYETWIENRLNGLFTVLNNGWAYQYLESWHGCTCTICDAIWWQMRTYCTIGDNRSYHSQLCTICDPIRCTDPFQRTNMDILL